MTGPPAVLELSRIATESTWEQPIEAQMEREARAMARVCRTDDAWAGITDVAARRVPQFRGH
jgi:2-(1,2-epoxy-1,2-dihydrophenyl)acetyl-CoA isomerase